MRLTDLEISGFRAITRLSLALGDITVLLGEHNTAKSTILDALDACLSVNARDPVMDISADDFCPFAGTEGTPRPRTTIIVTVEETEPSEWGAEGLGAVAPPARTPQALRRLRFRIRAERHPAGDITREVHLDDAPASDPQRIGAAWAALRQAMPVLHLRADRYIVGGAPPASDEPQSADGISALHSFRDLCHAQGRLPPKVLRETLRQAEGVLEGLTPEMLRAPSLERLSLEAIDNPRAALSRLAGGIAHYRPGTGAQAAGVFLLMAMMLSARGPRASLKGTSPIVLIEEPEAHLHPIVASMSWGLLQELRAQVLATTYSGEIVASTPLDAVRRLVRRDHTIEVRSVDDRVLHPDELRRISYHVRVKRGGSLFARCWVLIEGETEGWLLPELANLLGYSLPAEGIECIEFAQCGVDPLVKTADALGIAWHLLTDGDTAGRVYASAARQLLHTRPEREHITALRTRDIEEYLFKNGFAHVYRIAAGFSGASHERPERARAVIHRAIKNTSKPQMALRAAEAIAKAGPQGVPPLLRDLLERAVATARRTAAAPYLVGGAAPDTPFTGSTGNPPVSGAFGARRRIAAA